MSNSNIDEIGKLNIEKFLNRVAYFNGYDDSDWEKYGSELVDELKQAIQQELLKARIETLEWLLEQEVEFGGLELKQSIKDRIANLQAKLKDTK